MTWATVSDATTTTHTAITATVAGWGMFSVVTDALDGVDFQYRAVEQAPLRVSAAMPISISDVTFTRP